MYIWRYKMVRITKRICAMISALLILSLMFFSFVSCGAEGPKGDPGAQGKDGVDGADGKDGKDGQTPFVGENGNWWIGSIDTGVRAAANDGRDGVDGKDGLDGKDGVDGKDGINGKDGVNGKDAITPQFLFDAQTGYLQVSYDNRLSWSMLVNIGDLVSDGKDGISVKSCSINDDGELVISYSDGTSENVGRVVASDGIGGKDGVGITDVSLIDGSLTITLSDGTVNNLGKITGADGVNGTDGVGIADASIDSDGNLLIKLSDNTELNLGKIVGKDGVNGINGVNGSNGIDGATPRLKIDTDTREWMVSYDNGENWEGLGVSATGSDGINGENGANGTNGNTPRLKIDAITDTWHVSYDNGETWEDLGVVATGPAGNDGRATIVKIGEDGYWYTSRDNGFTWDNTNVKAVGADGAEGNNGKDGRGIAKVEIIEDSLYITYTDSDVPVNVGKISVSAGDGGSAETPLTYTDGLAFYPIGDGSEYAVSIGNAIYMENIVIPSTYNGKPVTTILSKAFELPKEGSEENAVLKSVHLPKTIIKIQEEAFANCPSLDSLVIPSSVKEIGICAFLGIEVVTFDMSEEDIPSGQDWTEGYLGCGEIVWNK